MLPFLLLIMVVARLPITNPSPVFGLALLTQPAIAVAGSQARPSAAAWARACSASLISVMSVSIPRQEAADDSYLTMTLETADRGRADVLVTYVTEAPAWKPSARRSTTRSS